MTSEVKLVLSLFERLGKNFTKWSQTLSRSLKIFDLSPNHFCKSTI